MRGGVLGFERRRRWSDDQKLSIVSSVGVDGATVTQVAQRSEVSRQQIYAWRHELKKKGLWSADRGAVFVPVDFPSIANTLPEPVSAPPVMVELRLSRGRCLRSDSALDAASLTRLIQTVEAS